MDGKVAIITGGSEGIGYEAARLLAKKGASVVLVARNVEKLKRAVEGLGSGDHSYISADLSDVAQATRIIDETVGRYSRVDYLVNSAGMFLEKPTEDMSVSELDRVLRLNFNATAACSLEAVKKMIKQGSGAIVNLSSLAAFRDYPDELAYRASKQAVNSFTQLLGDEMASKGVQVYAVAPGSVDTPLLRKALEPKRAELEAFFKEKGSPMTLDEYFERILSPKDVALKIVDIIENPQAYSERVVQMKSYEF
ncbi:SDR family oxidoreductase [Candidatus Woesearchaeota archaeon]|nr:MAG: SDR family oxidoreductase [Candidatus Woesearchaeota archaeon]